MNPRNQFTTSGRATRRERAVDRFLMESPYGGLQNGGPRNGPKYTMIVIVGTPQKGPLTFFQHPHMELSGLQYEAVMIFTVRMPGTEALGHGAAWHQKPGRPLPRWNELQAHQQAAAKHGLGYDEESWTY